MLTAFGQVAASAAVAYADAATRFADCAFATSGRLTINAAGVVRAPPDQRQAAIEEAVSTGYRDYVNAARVVVALPRWSALVFLNELDRIRGPRMQNTPDETL